MDLSRILALISYYKAPIYLYTFLSTYIKEIKQSNAIICTSTEWYRFPSHFFVSNSSTLRFINPNVFGHLPHLYQTSLDDSHQIATSWSPTWFNDKNQQDLHTYLSSIDLCDYVIELNTKSNKSIKGDILVQYPFVDTNETPSLYRAFYIPYQQHHVVYNSYQVIKMKSNNEVLQDTSDKSKSIIKDEL